MYTQVIEIHVEVIRGRVNIDFGTLINLITTIA